MSEEIDLSEGVIERGGQLVANPDNPTAARAFVEDLRQRADEAEAQAKGATLYKAERLWANARQARRDADRIEETIRSGGAAAPSPRPYPRGTSTATTPKKNYKPSPWG